MDKIESIYHHRISIIAFYLNFIALTLQIWMIIDAIRVKIYGGHFGVGRGFAISYALSLLMSTIFTIITVGLLYLLQRSGVICQHDTMRSNKSGRFDDDHNDCGHGEPINDNLLDKKSARNYAFHAAQIILNIPGSLISYAGSRLSDIAKSKINHCKAR